MHVHYVPTKDDGLPTEAHKAAWMTLYPGQPYVVEATFRPVITTGPLYPTPGKTADEMKQRQSQQPRVRKWRHVRGLQDGQTYEIGISGEVGVKEWIAGDIEGLLEETKNGATVELRREMVPFEVVQGAEFTVKRPDEDGSLNDTI